MTLLTDHCPQCGQTHRAKYPDGYIVCECGAEFWLHPHKGVAYDYAPPEEE